MQNFIPGFGAHGGFQMSFGLGAFPFFPVFGTTLAFGQPLNASKSLLVFARSLVHLISENNLKFSYDCM